MSVIRPFCGIRPLPHRCSEVAAPPYDVVDYDEAQAYVADKPHSFLRVEKSEIGLDKGLDPHATEIFEHGAQVLRQLQEQGLMIRDGSPCFYLYQQRWGEHVQVGVVAGASVDEYQRDLIKKHEHTRADKEKERTLHVDLVGANTGPVFLTYRAVAEINAFADEVRARSPEVDFVSEDGIGHTLWVLSEEAEVNKLAALFLERVPHLYVADGHHRSAAASNVQQTRAAASPDHGGEEPYNYFLTVIFPHDQMKIMEYNRVVLDLNGLTPAALKEQIEGAFELSEAVTPAPDAPQSFGMYLDGAWYRLTAKAGSFPADHPVDSLDVAMLQNNLLAPILGIGDPRTDTRIQFVGGIRGSDELKQRADKFGGVAFAMYPTSIEQLMAIADAGEVMPPKSTWFEPKLRSGMVVRSIND